MPKRRCREIPRSGEASEAIGFADTRDEVVIEAVLGKALSCAGSYRLAARFVTFVHEQPKNARIRIDHADLSNRLDSSRAWKVKVHQSYVRAMLPKTLNRLFAAFNLCDHFHVRLKIYQDAQTFT